MLIRKLKCLNQPQSLVNRATDSVVIDLDRANLVALVDDKKAAQSCPIHAIVRVLNQNSVVLRHVLRYVGQQWEAEFADTSVIP